MSGEEWLKWWRWCGTLAMESRCYEKATTAFNTVANILKKEAIPNHPTWPVVTLTAAEQMIEELKLIEHKVDLKLLQFNIKRRDRELTAGETRRGHPQHDQHDWDSLDEIEQMISSGREVAEKIRGQSQSAEKITAANWSESRLLVHQSICESHRFSLGRHDETTDLALSFLTDAEVLIKQSDVRTHDSGLALIELYRAQARFRNAGSVALVAGPVNHSVNERFSVLCRRYETGPVDIPEKSEFRNLRRIRALVTDGRRFLDRAEPILRERRRNVGWISWFFERQLRSISMYSWASVLGGEAVPVPFFGIEAAPLGTKTLADRLLDESLRMISVDAYRLATILDAYAACYCSVKAWHGLFMRKASSDARNLADRATEMKKELKKAVDELPSMIGRREEPVEGRRLPGKAQMDHIVYSYIEHVKEHCARILGS